MTGKRSSCLAELAHGVQLVVGADELKVLHGRYRHAPVEVEAVVSVRVGGFPRLKKKHVAASTVFDVGQLRGCRMDSRWGGGGREETTTEKSREGERRRGSMGETGEHGEGFGRVLTSLLCLKILPITLMSLCCLQDQPTTAIR